MTHSKRTPFFVFIILLLAACAPVSTALPPAPDINQLNTAIAQTAAVALAQTGQAASPTFTNTVTPTNTATPLFTATATTTPTLTIPTDFATSTPEIPQIIVS